MTNEEPIQEGQVWVRCEPKYLMPDRVTITKVYCAHVLIAEGGSMPIPYLRREYELRREG